jgi:hypothetical protein
MSGLSGGRLAARRRPNERAGRVGHEGRVATVGGVPFTLPLTRH